MAWQQDENSGSGCCLGTRRRHRVRPVSAGQSGGVVEIRPKRMVHVQHINARPRDARFEKEMNMQQLYKSQGLQAGGISSGPLSMPKSKAARSPLNPSKAAQSQKIASGSASLPNSMDPGGNSDGAYGKREISASGSKACFASPSNVELADKNSVSENRLSASQCLESAYLEGSEAEAETHADNKRVSIKQPLTSNTLSTDNKTGDDDSAFSDSELAELSSSAVDDVATTPVKGGKLAVPSRPEEQTTPQSTPKHVNGVFTPPPTVNPTTVLFFIHGVGGSSNVWQTQIRYFAKEGYEVVAPDLIGHGLSCTPKNAKSYHFSEIVADMEEVFDKYCKKRNVVIGHSYGCSFAVMLARRRSRRVQKLVLISGGSPTPLAPQPGIFTMPTCLLGCLRPCLNRGFHKSAFHASGRPAVEKEEAFAIPTYVLQHTMNGQDWADGDELYHQWLLCPTLLVYGAQDKLVTLNEEEHMEETIYRSRLEVIPDASHMVMIEAPDEVNRLLHNFLTEDSTLCTKSNTPQPPAAQPPAQSPAQPFAQSPAQSPAQPKSPPLPRPEPSRSVSRMSARSTKSHKAMPIKLI